VHLSFRYDVHQFDTARDDASAAEVFEAELRPDYAFDRSMVLVDNLVQVLRLSDLDRRFALIARLQRHEV
jgi:hypothetical protein